MILLNINVRLIRKDLLRDAGKGTYMDAVLFENKNGRDDRGQDGYVVQSVSKEARERGDKGPIIGNWKDTERGKPAPRQQQRPAPRVDNPTDDGGDIPF